MLLQILEIYLNGWPSGWPSAWKWQRQNTYSLIVNEVQGCFGLVVLSKTSCGCRTRTFSTYAVKCINNICIIAWGKQRCSHIFQAIKGAFSASRLTYQIPCFFSWRPDPLVEAMDAFQQDWGPLIGFSNPLWYLIDRVLSYTCCQRAHPVWRGQAWYPVLLEILYFPRLIIPAKANRCFDVELCALFPGKIL